MAELSSKDANGNKITLLVARGVPGAVSGWSGLVFKMRDTLVIDAPNESIWLHDCYFEFPEDFNGKYVEVTPNTHVKITSCVLTNSGDRDPFIESQLDDIKKQMDRLGTLIRWGIWNNRKREALQTQCALLGHRRGAYGCACCGWSEE